MYKNKHFTEIYKNWKRTKDYLDLDYDQIKKLTILNNIIDENILNKLNSISYFLKNNDYKNPYESYLKELTEIFKTYKYIKEYFSSELNYNYELTSNYSVSLNEDNWMKLNKERLENSYETTSKEKNFDDYCKSKFKYESNNNWLNHDNNRFQTELEDIKIKQSAYFEMISELYRYALLKYPNNQKIKEIINTQKLSTEIKFKSKKSDSELKMFFKIKYDSEKNSDLFKICMQDLYSLFNVNYEIYQVEPIDICIKISEIIFNKTPSKDKRYYTIPIKDTSYIDKYKINTIKSYSKTASKNNTIYRIKTHRKN